MKTLFIAISYLFFSCGYGPIKTKPTSLHSNIIESDFYSFNMKSIDGSIINFNTYKGKKVLLVNTASECGYTPQYKELQKLHELYGNKVVVLGFPCNDFGGQEPDLAKDIQSFCEKNYGVTFQLFDKIAVKGKDTAPLYQWLTDKSKNGWNETAPSWNFCKYLINEKGELVKFFPSTVKPLSTEILDAIK